MTGTVAIAERSGDMTRTLALIPLAALALAGCQTLDPYGDRYSGEYGGYPQNPAGTYPPGDYDNVGYAQDGPARAQGVTFPYRAVGTEPFWSLDMDAQSIRYQGANGEQISVPTPPGRPSFNGMRYVADGMTVDVTYSRCSDRMSDRRYADTVMVDLPGGRTLRGCGGDFAGRPEMAVDQPHAGQRDLAGTRWQLLSVNGLPVESRDALISFDGQQFSGSVGCNRINADYVVDGMAVSFGPARTTRMACDPAVMGQERAFLDLLDAAQAQPVGQLTRRLGAIRYAPNGNMILSAPDGRVAVLSPFY